MPRISEALVWNPDKAKSPRGEWGCPSCGNEDSRVVETDRDTDFIRVRLRMCTRCGTKWSTEERRLDGPEAFFARAESRRWRAFTKHRFKMRTCLVCQEKYMSGKYMEHTQASRGHRVKLEVAERRRVEADRKYRRIHARHSRQVKKQNRGTRVCDQCGERFDATVPFPKRTHAGSSPVHKQAMKEAKYARKDRKRQAAKRGH